MDAIRGAVGHDGFGLPGIVAVNYRAAGLKKGSSRHVVQYERRKYLFTGQLILMANRGERQQPRPKSSPNDPLRKKTVPSLGPRARGVYLYKRHSFKDNSLH